MEAGCLYAELAPVAWGREGDVTEVEFEVEVGIVDPVRVVESEGDRDETLAENVGDV